jgi:hypothetical protein
LNYFKICLNLLKHSPFNWSNLKIPFQSGQISSCGRVEKTENLLSDFFVGELPGVDLLLVQGHQVVEAMEVEDLGELLNCWEFLNNKLFVVL